MELSAPCTACLFLRKKTPRGNTTPTTMMTCIENVTILPSTACRSGWGNYSSDKVRESCWGFQGKRCCEHLA
eukprot:1758904-Rhodomonas_salina.2